MKFVTETIMGSERNSPSFTKPANGPILSQLNPIHRFPPYLYTNLYTRSVGLEDSLDGIKCCCTDQHGLRVALQA